MNWYIRVVLSGVVLVTTQGHNLAPGKDSDIFLKDNTSLSANGIFRVPEEFSFSHPLMNSYSLSILTMGLGMEFKCTGFLKGPSICTGPFPFRLIYGVSYFLPYFVLIMVCINVSRSDRYWNFRRLKSILLYSI